MQFLFNLTLALRAIRTNLLRSVLTILIIGIGIMALVGILTGIEVIKSAVYSSFSGMGANSFHVTGNILKQKKNRHGGLNISITEAKNVTYDEARRFRQRYAVPSTVSISVTGDYATTVTANGIKTNPNVRTAGVDEAYFTINKIRLDAGRSFSPYEQEAGAYTCVLGHAIATRLFKNDWMNSIGRSVTAGAVKMQVIGVAEEKGGNMGNNADNILYMPITTARAIYGGGLSYDIGVLVPSVAMKEVATDEAEGLFRGIRKLPLGTADNFSVLQSDSIATILLDSISTITIAAIVIAIITLLGSVIGLMNIMLVSVAERTREIGVSKALGAKSSVIKGQFLTESVLISLMGGALGILLGIPVGNVVGFALQTGFVIPWFWMMMSISLCALVGIISGIYPAIKASRLDPIVALRYE